MKKSIFWVGGIVILGIIIALVLIFSLKKPTYEVSFMSDGVEVMDSIKVREDGTVVEPKEPVKEGYEFVGWYSDSEKFDFSTKITEDITLEAKWIKEGAEMYTVTFDSKGGNTVSSIEVEEDKTVILPTPKKDGYTFVGWFDKDKKVTSTTKITENMTLVAKWEKEETTTKKKTTKKKTTTTKTTTTTTTEKTTTTTTAAKKDVLAYDLVKYGNSDEGQGILYLTKNGQRVAGTCTIVTSTNEVVDNVKVDASGYRIDMKFVKEVKNIKVN